MKKLLIIVIVAILFSFIAKTSLAGDWEWTKKENSKLRYNSYEKVDAKDDN